MTTAEALRRAVVTAIERDKDVINTARPVRVTYECIFGPDEITVLPDLKLSAVKV